MRGSSMVRSRRVVRQVVLGSLVLLGAACAEERVGPTTPPVTVGDGGSDGVDGLPAAILDTRSSAPGIVFGSWNMTSEYLNDVHTGWLQGGPLDPSNIITKLSDARAKKGRVVVKLCKGRDAYVKNSDGTFSLSKWKSLVFRYKDVGLGPYIADGTILGHMLIDEPHRAARWGGQPISQQTLEEMARFSKSLWPAMPTLVRVVPSWLASASVTYQHLDAGWTQYVVGKGSASTWLESETAAAKRKGLGLVVGLNVLDGGNGSSGIPGYTRGKWAMSASEIRNYGLAMLANGYACGFLMWTHNTTYYGRSDIRSAMADVSAKAKKNPKTSCRQ